MFRALNVKAPDRDDARFTVPRVYNLVPFFLPDANPLLGCSTGCLACPTLFPAAGWF